ncbi:MAG: hypothetical protein ACRD12_19555 [Acidimicrobiales bacterium]
MSVLVLASETQLATAAQPVGEAADQPADLSKVAAPRNAELDYEQDGVRAWNDQKPDQARPIAGGRPGSTP